MITLQRTNRMDRAFDKALVRVEKLIDGEVGYDGRAKGAVVFLGAYARILSSEVHLAALELMNEKRQALPQAEQIVALKGKGMR